MRLHRILVSLILVSLLAVLLIPSALPFEPAAQSSPHIAVTEVPSIGEGSHVSGYIWSDSGDYDPSDYAITMALAVTRGSTIWSPKPTYADPSVSLSETGKFLCPFDTGGDDKFAQVLYVYLIPADFVPTSDYEATERAALDKVTIYRTEDGAVDIRQTSLPVVSGYEYVGRKHPVETPKLSINFSPYIAGSSPDAGSAVPMENIRWMLGKLHPYADTIRLFGVSGELSRIYETAKTEYGFRIIAGCWFDRNYSEDQIYRELDGLIELSNTGYVDIACVGSEVLYRSDMTASRLAGYIRYVRAGITDPGIAVTTSDSADAFLQNRALVDACDILLLTCYPFFDGTPAEDAVDSLIGTYTRVCRTAPGKTVIISETGWPTSGSPEGGAVPGQEQAAAYTRAVYDWSREADVEVVFFSNIDESYKQEGANGDVGGSWGHFTDTGRLKAAYTELYEYINSTPTTDLDAYNWAEYEINQLLTAGVITNDGPSLYHPEKPVSRAVFMHDLVGALDMPASDRDYSGFSDVNRMAYYDRALGVGREAGLIFGVGDNMCQPDAPLSRQDLFLMIYRAMDYLGITPVPNLGLLDSFSDGDAVSDYARAAVSALVATGIVAGDDEGRINPRQPCTRAEAAVLLYRIHTGFM